MKNLFFALAFMLIGTFAFANNSEVESFDKDVVIENLKIETSLQLEEDMMGCFGFTLSCGVSGTACGDDVGGLIDLILFVDDLIC